MISTVEELRVGKVSRHNKEAGLAENYHVYNRSTELGANDSFIGIATGAGIGSQMMRSYQQ